MKRRSDAYLGTDSLPGTLAISVFLMTVIFLLVTGGVAWWISGEFAYGIGLGAFCAVWGGPGFGVMAAGAVWVEWEDGHS